MGDIEAVNTVHRIIQDKDTALRVARALIQDHERTIVAQRAELEAMRRTASAIADERSSLATELFEMRQHLAYAAGIVRDLEGKMQPVNEYVAALEQQIQHLCLSASRPLGYTDEVVLVNREMLHELAKMVECEVKDITKPVLIPCREETQRDRCPRCGSILDNVERGISVVAGGIRICTPCINPGETEVARARGLT